MIRQRELTAFELRTIAKKARLGSRMQTEWTQWALHRSPRFTVADKSSALSTAQYFKKHPPYSRQVRIAYDRLGPGGINIHR